MSDQIIYKKNETLGEVVQILPTNVVYAYRVRKYQSGNIHHLFYKESFEFREDIDKKYVQHVPATETDFRNRAKDYFSINRITETELLAKWHHSN